MNLIGLDISKVSTAMVIETNGKEFIFSYNNKKPNFKWNKVINHIVTIRTYEYAKEEEYSKSEISKLDTFIEISNDILVDILDTIDTEQETVIHVEGYSYGRDPGPIIDLVGIGSNIRSKIRENVPNIKSMVVTSPKRLKTMTCESAYGFEMVEKGVRVVKTVKVLNTNEQGVKGGDFSKHDMFQAIIDSGRDSILKDYMNENYEDIIVVKSFPKPLEDIDDAWWLKETIKDYLL